MTRGTERRHSVPIRWRSHTATSTQPLIDRYRWAMPVLFLLIAAAAIAITL